MDEYADLTPAQAQQLLAEFQKQQLAQADAILSSATRAQPAQLPHDAWKEVTDTLRADPYNELARRFRRAWRDGRLEITRD